jgi:hypothetical protein
MDALLDLVMKRTGLAPRTFSPSLAVSPRAAPDASRVEREAPRPRDADDA